MRRIFIFRLINAARYYTYSLNVYGNGVWAYFHWYGEMHNIANLHNCLHDLALAGVGVGGEGAEH